MYVELPVHLHVHVFVGVSCFVRDQIFNYSCCTGKGPGTGGVYRGQERPVILIFALDFDENVAVYIHNYTIKLVFTLT